MEENYKKLLDHVSILKEIEAYKVAQIKELVNQKEKLAQLRKVKKTEAMALKHELEKAKSALAQAKEELVDAQARATEVEKLKGNLKATNENVQKLNVEVEQLKNEVLNAKINGIAEYKGSFAYQMVLGYIVAVFLAKKRIKIRRMLQRAHNINLDCLEGIENELTFSSLAGDMYKEGEEVEQEIQPSDPSRQSL